MWSGGGFLLADRQDGEYQRLSEETGVPVSEIPSALTALDKLFPVSGGWFRQPSGSQRRVLMMMPAALRGMDVGLVDGSREAFGLADRYPR